MKKSLQDLEVSWDLSDLLIKCGLKSQINVLEIGAGSNPYLSKELVFQYDINYHIQDIDESELAKSSDLYFTKISKPISDFDETECYDLIISRMVLEHVKNPVEFHTEVKKLLAKDGICIHFFATLYNIASIANLILPEHISRYILLKIANRDTYQHEKFPAFYRKCYGPTKGNILFFQNLGYTILEYHGFVGHNYFWKNNLIYSLEKFWSRFLYKFQNPYLCSNAIVVLKK